MAAKKSNKNVPYRGIDLLLVDMNGVARGKRIPPEDLNKALKGELKIIGTLYALDIFGHNVDAAGLAMDTGDGDYPLIPATGQLLPTDWAREPTAAILMSMLDHQGNPWFIDPRNVLAKVLAGFKKWDLTPVVAVELEFFLIDKELNPEGLPQPPLNPLTGRRTPSSQTNLIQELEDYDVFLAGVERACGLQGIKTTSALAEYGNGQFEINLNHQADPLAAADEAFLLRRAVRGVARSMGMDATFMSKPYREEAGSGQHIHISLLDKKGNNVFAGEGKNLNPALEQALGGLMANMVSSMAIFAPNANSYRRFQSMSYAPTYPTWGFDNRTVALRIVGTGANRRIEHRLSGAEANPYLVLATVLAGILDGLERQLSPGPLAEGNAYNPRDQQPLPTRWSASLDAFRQGTVIPSYLGPEYAKVYHTCRSYELDQFEAASERTEMRFYLPVL